MKTRFSIRAVSLTVCAGLLLDLCGCADEKREPTTATTTTTAMATAASTTTTAVAETTTTSAATTATPTTTAKASSDTVPRFTVEVDMEEGSFLLDGHRFQLHENVTPLLEFLGEPESQGTSEEIRVNNRYLGDRYFNHYVYVYPPLLLFTTRETYHLNLVFFTDDTYSVNGVRVGDTEEKVLSVFSEPVSSTVVGAAWPTGPVYVYEGTHARLEINFEGDSSQEILEDFLSRGNRVASSTRIECICLT